MLTVSIIPITELALCELPTFLCLDTQRSDRAGLEPFQADFFPGFLAKAVCAFFDSGESRIDLAEQLSLPVPGPQLEAELGLLRGPVVGIREICSFILHVVNGAVHFVH